MPSENRDCYQEFLKIHIPGSQYIDIDNLSDKSNELPHMLPKLEKFEIFSRICGINNNSIIVIYDSFGIFSSPRIWWMYKYFGFNKVYILNGGLKKWKEEKRLVTKKIIKKEEGNFQAKINHKYLSKKQDIIKNIYNKNCKIIDARSKNRFYGKEKEPRKNLKSGKIPNSINLPWKKLISENGMLKSNIQLNNIFNKLNIKKKEKIISTCGSGITACIITLSLTKLKFDKLSVYDGSWAEWGMRNK